MLNKKDLFPIAIGSFNIFNKDMDGIRYSIEKGQNYISTSYKYEDGKAMRIVADVIKNYERKRLFITTMLEERIEKIEDIEKQVDKYLQILGTMYIDCLQVHSPNISELPIVDIYHEMFRLVKNGKVRYLGASNLKLEVLKLLKSDGIKLFNYEGVYNLECKLNENVGILEYCKENDIIFTAYQPLRRMRTARQNYKLLVELSTKYGKTQNQIVLNWLVNEKNIMPIIKSGGIEHIEENLEAIKFHIAKEDLIKLNQFRRKEFDTLKVDWDYNGNGVPIYLLYRQYD